MRRNPILIGAGVLAVVVAGLLAWGLTREALDRAHPISLARAAACPPAHQITLSPEDYCSASWEVADGELVAIGHGPCACDGPGQEIAIGARSAVIGSTAWASCVVRGPALILRQEPRGAIFHFQVPPGQTAFARSAGKQIRCWMVPTPRPKAATPGASWTASNGRAPNRTIPYFR